MLLLAAGVTCLHGCATVTNGRTQAVSVQTFQDSVEVVDARCTLAVGRRPPAFVTTPGTVPVRRSSDDLVVTCRKDDVGTGTATFKSATSGATAGNVLFGASLIVAFPTDFVTGAAFKYPDLLRVELQRPTAADDAAAATEPAVVERPAGTTTPSGVAEPPRGAPAGQGEDPAANG